MKTRDNTMDFCPMCGTSVKYAYYYFTDVDQYFCEKSPEHYMHEYSCGKLTFQKFKFPQYKIFYSYGLQNVCSVQFNNGLHLTFKANELDFDPQSPKEPDKLLIYSAFE